MPCRHTGDRRRAAHNGRPSRYAAAGGWRAAGFGAGAALLALAAALPGIRPAGHGVHPDHDIRLHMVQHLLVGMYAPLAFALSGPVTAVLPAFNGGARRVVARLMRSRPAGVVRHPVTAAVLDVGGLYLLYLTPLYAATQASPALHGLVHGHFLAAGYLFAWSIAGTDPVPHRPGLPLRAGVLVAAAGAHGALAKLLYAHAGDWPPQSGSAAAQVREAAQIMYYGGDLAELLLAVALFAGWYLAAPAARARRRASTSGRGRRRAPGRHQQQHAHSGQSHARQVPGEVVRQEAAHPVPNLVDPQQLVVDDAVEHLEPARPHQQPADGIAGDQPAPAALVGEQESPGDQGNQLR